MGIEAHPGILGGKPVVRGTRVPVDLLLELVDAGLNVDDILGEYPHLKREDVLVVFHKQFERLPRNIKRRVKQRP